MFKMESLNSCHQQRKSSLQLPAQETNELDRVCHININTDKKMCDTVSLFPMPELHLSFTFEMRHRQPI